MIREQRHNDRALIWNGMRIITARLSTERRHVPEPWPDYERLEEGQPTPEEIEAALEASPLVRHVGNSSDEARPGGLPQ